MRWAKLNKHSNTNTNTKANTNTSIVFITVKGKQIKKEIPFITFLSAHSYNGLFDYVSITVCVCVCCLSYDLYDQLFVYLLQQYVGKMIDRKKNNKTKTAKRSKSFIEKKKQKKKNNNHKNWYGLYMLGF